MTDKAITVQLASAQSKIDQAKTLVDLYEKQTAALEVKAGIAGQVAALPVGANGPIQVGTHVTAGTPVAEVTQLNKLKAALQIAETQAHDIQIGQPASIDTHNGVVPGHVSRIDPTVLNGTRTVDVALDGPLPPGAVPGLSVDGTIDLARMNDVLYVGRPALGNENSTLSLFKLDPDGKGRDARAGEGGPRLGQQHSGARRAEGRRHGDSLRHVAVRQRGPHPAGVDGRDSERNRDKEQND